MTKNIFKIFISVTLLAVVSTNVFAASTTTNSFKVFLTVNQETAPQGGGGQAGGGGVGTNLPIITNVLITPTRHGATISYNTSIPATSAFSYGKNILHNDNLLSDSTFITFHTFTISNLSADTDYFFFITATSPIGSQATYGVEKFRTLKVVSPVNALSFSATAQTEDIKLDWKLPKSQENSVVRIVRSESFYPTNVNDGITIFEGSGVETLLDQKVIKGVRYYYTLFVKDSNGNYSSGAVADAKILLPGEKPETQEGLFDRLSKAPNVDTRISSLSLNDFVFSQPGRDDFSVKGDESLFIEGDKELTIKLSYARVPELLKTIAVTLSDPDDVNRKFTFLLRINEEKTFYEATIAPLGKSGEYKMDIAIVDYKNQGLKRINGNLLAVVSKAFKGEGVFVPIQAFTVNDLMVYLILVLALFGLSYISARRIDLSYLRERLFRYRRG